MSKNSEVTRESLLDKLDTSKKQTKLSSTMNLIVLALATIPVIQHLLYPESLALQVISYIVLTGLSLFTLLLAGTAIFANAVVNSLMNPTADSLAFKNSGLLMLALSMLSACKQRYENVVRRFGDPLYDVALLALFAFSASWVTFGIYLAFVIAQSLLLTREKYNAATRLLAPGPKNELVNVVLEMEKAENAAKDDNG